MADFKPLYSTCVAVLGFICFVVGATAVGIPMWGYFESPNAGYAEERGYFGPWGSCKLLLYNRKKCGEGSSGFRLSVAVWTAGLVASIGIASLAVFSFLSVIQLAMISSKGQVVMRYSATIISKLALVLLATLLAITSAGLFSLQDDGRGNGGFELTRGPGFYLQILVIILDGILLLMTIYEVIFARRNGGDPTKATPEPTTYGNIGFRESVVRGAVSMTDASGKPYATTAASNGSMGSMSTMSTTMGSTNGSTVGSSVTRSPLRSSLKKPRPKQEQGLGIQNPGFSGTSPTLGRNGSTKKVRIQTQSTEV